MKQLLDIGQGAQDSDPWGEGDKQDKHSVPGVQDTEKEVLDPDIILVVVLWLHGMLLFSGSIHLSSMGERLTLGSFLDHYILYSFDVYVYPYANNTVLTTVAL